jgi:hypothetical protein
MRLTDDGMQSGERTQKEYGLRPESNFSFETVKARPDKEMTDRGHLDGVEKIPRQQTWSRFFA